MYKFRSFSLSLILIQFPYSHSDIPLSFYLSTPLCHILFSVLLFVHVILISPSMLATADWGFPESERNVLFLCVDVSVICSQKWADILCKVLSCVTQWLKMGFRLVIGYINNIQVVTTINYCTIAALHNLQSLHTNLFSLSALAFVDLSHGNYNSLTELHTPNITHI
jgi:hypothetical protein